MNDLEQMIMTTLHGKANEMPDHVSTPDGLATRTRQRALMKGAGAALGGLAALSLVVGLVIPSFASDARTTAPVATQPNVPKPKPVHTPSTTPAVTAPVAPVTTPPAKPAPVPVKPARAEEFVYAQDNVLSVRGRDNRQHRVIATLAPDAHISSVAVSPDAQWVYFSTTPDCEGTAYIGKVALAGGPVTKVSDAHASDLRMSPDGSKLAYTVGQCGSAPAVLNLATGTEHLVAAPEFDAINGSLPGDGVQTPSIVSSVEWSPDGSQIIFSTDVNKAYVVNVSSDGTSFAVARSLTLPGAITGSENRGGTWNVITSDDSCRPGPGIVCAGLRVDVANPAKVQKLGHGANQLVSFDIRSHDWLMTQQTNDAPGVTTSWFMLPGDVAVSPQVTRNPTGQNYHSNAAAWIPVS